MSKHTKNDFPGFRQVPKTGVIYVTNEARKLGFDPFSSEWANLGQGAPEAGELPGGPPRITSVDVGVREHEYSPVVGRTDLRDAVAALYNRRYRSGKKSQYTRNNVAISSGGRLGLTRVVSTLGQTHVGHFLPDYTAYEELLDSFGTFIPIPISLSPDDGYTFSVEALERKIIGMGLSTLLLSNPCNPTGKLIHGTEMRRWIEVCRKLKATLILDEFYSHYIYVAGLPYASAAAHIEDVNKDPIVLIDGLTKNWRYPGWRVSWTVGPEAVIESIGSAGSFLDGGCSHPMQRAAVDLLKPEVADAEAHSIQAAFAPKRERLLGGLRSLGIEFPYTPEAGFYAWGDVSGLPSGLNTGMEFFRKALEHKVVVVPGEFFDINPGGRRPERPSQFKNYVRFSYGPGMETIERGLQALKDAL